MSEELLLQQGRKRDTGWQSMCNGEWGARRTGVGSTQGTGGEHTHPVTPRRPGSIAQNEGLREESKPQALDLGKTITDNSNETAKPPGLVTK